jgi:diaminopimelate epimerase
MFLNTGSPHVVVFKNEKLQDINILQEAHQIRYNQEFKAEGVNVNFVYEGADALVVRTYERGVEDETLSCGTGVTAVALAMAIKNNEFGRIGKQLKTMGGLLEVVFNRNEEKIFNEIYLSGPAVKVFEGEIAL